MPTDTEPARVSRATPLASAGPAVAAAASGMTPNSLLTWYLGLIPHWLGAQPIVRRRLLLRTHEWIVERVLAPGACLSSAAEDLCPGGALTRTLRELVPGDDAPRWEQFVRVLVANLRHALLLPVARRNEAWIRWLFLIPYSVRWEPGKPALAAAGGGGTGA